MHSLSRAVGLTTVLILSYALPSTAAAQWYVAGYIGDAHTQNATVSIDVPSASQALDFHDVTFRSESFQPRRYYGLRLGRLSGSNQRLGYEIELIHLKVIANEDRSYSVTAKAGTTFPASAAVPMNLVVQEFRMTHGLNFAFFNVVMRRPLGAGGSGPVSLMLRAGGGPTFPHAETIVNGGLVHHYEYGGLAGQGAAGLEVRLPYRAMAMVEYKLTYTHPELTITNGTASTSALSHHITFGVGFALTKR
jgi:hypothetical protein